MAQQEASEASVVSSSPAPSWWDPTNPFPSWPPPSIRWAPEDDGVSAGLSGEPHDSQLWSQVLLNIGSGGDLSRSNNNGENYVDVLSSKTIASTEQIYNDPACDYLKKMDGGWGFGNPTSLNSFHKQLISDYNSDLVSNWSIAPPTSQVVDRMIGASACFIAPSMDRYPPSGLLHVKHEFTNMPSYTAVESEPSFDHGIGYQIGLNNSVLGLNRVFEHDLISFNGCLSKPSPGFRPLKLALKGPDSSEGKRQVYESSSSTRGSGRTSEGKKKKSEDSSDTSLKKSKLDRSTVSSIKLQAPKMKLADKITALQQIVSPFGKTDTASVLLEAINYIGFLQEQVQLLSDPYLKSSASKDHNSWGLMERKQKADAKVDLRSRGLCLVPISSTPQIYREMSGPDYWTPTTYRGCLYR